jgi:hypothetical protein
MLVYEKIQPRRYIFEETGEERETREGDVYIDQDGRIKTWDVCWSSTCAYKILRKVEE